MFFLGGLPYLTREESLTFEVDTLLFQLISVGDGFKSFLFDMPEINARRNLVNGFISFIYLFNDG